MVIFSIRIQAGQTGHQKRKKEKIHVWRVFSWAGGFSESLKVTCKDFSQAWPPDSVNLVSKMYSECNAPLTNKYFRKGRFRYSTRWKIYKNAALPTTKSRSLLNLWKTITLAFGKCRYHRNVEFAKCLRFPVIKYKYIYIYIYMIYIWWKINVK